MNECLTRRDALKSLLTATGALGATAALSSTAAAATAAAKAAAAAAPAGLPHVNPQDPTAVALAYFEDAGKVDAKQFPTYKAGQLCSNCLQGTGDANAPWRGCNLYPGKLVSAKGWCKVYIKKP
jgi:hypothetical protein